MIVLILSMATDTYISHNSVDPLLVTGSYTLNEPMIDFNT